MATGMRRLVCLCGRPRCLHVLRNANAVVRGDRVAEEGDATCCLRLRKTAIIQMQFA